MANPVVCPEALSITVATDFARATVMDHPAMISFIVPAHDEELLLGATLDSIHDAARTVGEPYEIVVADDASTDRTAALARQRGARVVSVAHRQIAATRNAGAREARGDMLVFVDADTRINPLVVSEAVKVIRRGAVGGGTSMRFDGVVPMYARLMLPVMLFYFRLSKTAAGCFLFCTREAFAAVNGFDEAYFGAEEVILSKALKSRGDFVILDVPVITSGRKLRTYSARELFAAMWRIARKGRKGVQQREGLELWYAERRPDSRHDD
jgi:glycosyltransferase involved in cell wall biosynthesis